MSHSSGHSFGLVGVFLAAWLLAGGCSTDSESRDGSANLSDASDQSPDASGPPIVSDVLDVCSGHAAFPSSAGVLNVTDPMFGADPTGMTDSTEAIMKAISTAYSLYGPYGDVPYLDPTVKGAYTDPYINPTSAPASGNKIVYFPAGTYLVSDTLARHAHDQMSTSMVTAITAAGAAGLDADWKADANYIATNGRLMSGMVLVGDCWATTTLKLKDGAPGYDDASSPKPVVFQASTLYDPIQTVLNQYGDFLWVASSSSTAACAQCLPKDTACASTNNSNHCTRVSPLQLYALVKDKGYIYEGQGADAYDNFIVNLTIDVGSNNPGAVGIDMLANNGGGLRDVAVRAESGSGVAGILSTRGVDGPAMVERVSVSGFETGIDVGQHQASITFEHILLSGQRAFALRNQQNALAIHDLNIIADDGVVPIANIPPVSKGQLLGQIVVDEGRIWSATVVDLLSAIPNAGYLNLRKLTTSAGGSVDGVYGPNNVQLASPSTQSWSLTVSDPPDPPHDDPSTWASVTDYGADPTGTNDSTPALLDALKSGKSTVFFPTGHYYLQTTPIAVPSTVQWIVGAGATLYLKAPMGQSPKLAVEHGVFQFHSANAVTVQDITVVNATTAAVSAFEQIGPGPLVIRNVAAEFADMLYRDATGGPTYFENIEQGVIRIYGSAPVWGRQVNIERDGSPAVANGTADIVNYDGAPVWLLGVKTERDETIIQNIGGIVEVLGGEIIPDDNATDLYQVPAFINQSGGHLLVSIVEDSGNLAKVKDPVCTGASNATVDALNMQSVQAYSILVGHGPPPAMGNYPSDACTFPFRDGTAKSTGATSIYPSIVMPQYVTTD